jgi:hypothetical protein
MFTSNYLRIRLEKNDGLRRATSKPAYQNPDADGDITLDIGKVFRIPPKCYDDLTPRLQRPAANTPQ